MESGQNFVIVVELLKQNLCQTFSF